ncbi:ATP-binding protein [Mucilaginibacter pedocola]|uniref:Histidine kinase/HSP90-like ATPase domain-containing protein n=1 Tax=Mucilaginibacter pedocola TaxID=1792845 RepID=A0A1S9PHH1_9SPHI|nr:ATP-binding protein [Mucilaginibacter pedocola]OOQ60369.1 hypothetical protein BC343_25440 [Mucilaginibacter pedocola]
MRIIPVQQRFDFQEVSKEVLALSAALKMPTLKQTQLLTAASELVNNMISFAKGGLVYVSTLSGGSKGILMVFEDKGPGIDNVDLAMVKGFSTIGNAGLGLSNAKQLCDEFHIKTTSGSGTIVTIVKQG